MADFLPSLSPLTYPSCSSLWHPPHWLDAIRGMAVWCQCQVLGSKQLVAQVPFQAHLARLPKLHQASSSTVLPSAPAIDLHGTSRGCPWQSSGAAAFANLWSSHGHPPPIHLVLLVQHPPSYLYGCSHCSLASLKRTNGRDGATTCD